ncbi:hypothetical protein ACK2J6_001198 [Vibrio fluvialis]
MMEDTTSIPKFTEISKTIKVSAAVHLSGNETLFLYSSKEGRKEVEKAFFNALSASLKFSKTIAKHIKVAKIAAEAEAQKYGLSLNEYGFDDSEPRQVIESIVSKLTSGVEE